MKRINRILKYILQSNQFVRIDELAGQFRVSLRTIREDLVEIEDYLKENNVEFLRDRTDGYFIDTSKIQRHQILELIRNINPENNYYSVDERYHVLLQHMLCLEGSVTYDELSERALVSKTTLIKEFNKVKEWLEKNHISVKKKQRIGITVEYDEFDWRKAVLEYLVPNMKDIDIQSWIDSNFSVLLIYDPIIDGFVRKLFKNANPKAVSYFIHKYEEDQKVVFSNNFFIVLLFYICISLGRIQMGKIIPDANKSEYDVETELCIWMKKNKAFLSDISNCEVPEVEAGLIMQYLSGAQKIYDDEEELNQIGAYENDVIVSTFISNVEAILDVDFSKDIDLYRNLLFHIMSAIHRVMYDIRCNNPLREEVYDLYPEICIACKKAVGFLENDLGKEIDEDEISYLAMHVGAAIENIEGSIEEETINVIVVCADGIGASHLLCSRLQKEFSNIVIKRVVAVTQLYDLELEGIDIIISTVSIFLNKDIRTIKVSPMLRESDVARIRKEIQVNTISKRSNKYENYVVNDLMHILVKEIPELDYARVKKILGNYFDKSDMANRENDSGILNYLRDDLIELNVEAQNWKEAITLGGKLLYDQGYIEFGYIDKMISIFEEVGNYISIYEGVVMPHAKPTDGVIKTGFSFLTLKNPVSFGDDENVRIVMTLAADNSMVHLKTIRDIAAILDDEFIEKVLKLSNKNDFISYIKKRMLHINSQDKS